MRPVREHFTLPIPHISCQTAAMKYLTTSICLILAVLLGSAGVSWGADYQKGYDAYIRRDYATAHKEWGALSAKGNANAQLGLGLMYSKGQGVSRNNKSALILYALSAVQGNSKAQFNLALMYHAGRGVPKDYKFAVTLYRRAEKRGISAAATGLGTMYETGRGVSKNTEMALLWYHRAAKQGNLTAYFHLGRILKGRLRTL